MSEYILAFRGSFQIVLLFVCWVECTIDNGKENNFSNGSVPSRDLLLITWHELPRSLAGYAVPALHSS